MIPPLRGEMGGLRFHISETGELTKATVDVLEKYQLKTGQHMGRLLYRMPPAYRQRLRTRLRLIQDNEISGIFTHPMLVMDLKTVWYKWQIQPIRRENIRGFRFCGAEIRAPLKSNDIELCFEYHGAIWKKSVG